MMQKPEIGWSISKAGNQALLTDVDNGRSVSIPEEILTEDDVSSGRGGLHFHHDRIRQ